MLAFPNKVAAQPQPRVADAEGFVPARTRRGRNVSALVEVFEPFPAVGETVNPALSGAAASGEGARTMASGNAGTGIEEIDSSDDEHGGAAAGPTLDALREAWEAKQRLLRDAEGKLSADDRLLVAMRCAAEEAKAAYDAAKPRGSDSRRLQRAERVLGKAQKARDRTASQINQLRVDFKDMLERLQDRLEDENARVASAQEGVDNVRRDLNGGGQRGDEGAAAAQALCQGLLQSILQVGQVMQTVAGAISHVAPEQAQALATTISTLEQGYHQANATLQHQTSFYNVGDEDDDDADPEDMDQDHEPEGPGGSGPKDGDGSNKGASGGATVEAAAGTPQAAVRQRPEDDSQPPPPKLQCTGSAAMDTHEEAQDL